MALRQDTLGIDFVDPAFQRGASFKLDLSLTKEPCRKFSIRMHSKLILANLWSFEIFAEYTDKKVSDFVDNYFKSPHFLFYIEVTR